MLTAEADKVLAILQSQARASHRFDEFRHQPLVSLFMPRGWDSYWFGNHKIEVRREGGYVLADIDKLEIHTFGESQAQALLRVVEHAASIMEELLEESNLGKEHQLLLARLKSAFKQVASLFTGNAPASPNYVYTSAKSPQIAIQLLHSSIGSLRTISQVD